MRMRYWLGLLLVAGSGCSSMNHTEKDALVGTGVGAGAMALATRGNPVATVFGGLVGGLFGAAIGNSEDRHERHEKAYAQAQANAAAYAARNQMQLSDIIQMSQRGTSEDIIIRQIDATGSVFNLTTNDILDLQNQGVSRNVIAVMQSRRYARPVVVAPPPGAIIIADPPPPPVSVGIGVHGRF